jgi:hypothetical protein
MAGHGLRVRIFAFVHFFFIAHTFLESLGRLGVWLSFWRYIIYWFHDFDILGNALPQH